MTKSKLNAFTLIELLVVISIIAILAGIALPVFSEVQIRGAQTKGISNAKQILLGCKLYAMDHNSIFPGKEEDQNGNPTNNDVSSANEALAALLPDYLKTEQLFFMAKSAFTPLPPDEKFASSGQKLTAGENHWAYVLNMTETSSGGFPLLADGFASPSDHTYTDKEGEKGGVWKGKKAIVGRVDGGAEALKLNRAMKVPGSPNGNDFFDNSGQDGWLSSRNQVVNPK
jgi:prepilin-type N-terminal cleavage/methylation domain-containing protein